MPDPATSKIALEAKRCTDALYGHYGTGTATGPSRNLFDVRDQTYSTRDLLWFANYLVTGHRARNPVYPGTSVLATHNAVLSRPAAVSNEAALLEAAIQAWIGAGTNRDRLLLVRRNWSGAQRAGNVYIQRWNMGNLTANRRQFWRTFRTMIHEYLHKVTHPNYKARARTLGRRREQIFTEGGTSYFDRSVWQTLWPAEIRSNAQLRQLVEGGPYPFDASETSGSPMSVST